MRISLALVPVLTALAAVVGVGTVLLLRRERLRSAAGICTGYLLMLGFGLAFNLEPLVSGETETELAVGLTTMAGLVLIRSMIVRRSLDAAERMAAPDPAAAAASRESSRGSR